MNALFMASLGLYFAATLLCFANAAFKKDGGKKSGRIVLILAVAVHLAYVIWRGITAHRLPLANQFEFATMFALLVAVLGLVLDFRNRLHMAWILTLCAPMAFLLQSYAALQPREITELMPALKSAWFGLDAQHCYFLRLHLGRTGMVHLLELGSERDMGSDHLDCLCHLSPSAFTYEMARQTHGLVCLTGVYLCDVYLCRRKHTDERLAQLCIIQRKNEFSESASASLLHQNVTAPSQKTEPFSLEAYFFNIYS